MTTRKQIIAAAKECDALFDVIAFGRSDGTLFSTIELERFYAIAFEAGRVAEREDCAKVCEALPSLWPTERVIADECSSAIRARGESK